MSGFCYPYFGYHYPFRDNYDKKVREEDASFSNKSADNVCQKAKTGKHFSLTPGVMVASCVHGKVFGSANLLEPSFFVLLLFTSVFIPWNRPRVQKRFSVQSFDSSQNVSQYSTYPLDSNYFWGFGLLLYFYAAPLLIVYDNACKFHGRI